MSDQEIKNWDQRLTDQQNRGWHNYLRRRIHLDRARVVEPLLIAGEFIYVEEVSSASASASICLNQNQNDPLDLIQGTEIKTIFVAMYLTNEAQPGEWIDLLIGINFGYKKPLTGQNMNLQAQPVVELTHAIANTNVTPAQQICTKVLIKADVNNTQTAWIDFRTPAVQNACFPLDPGDSIDDVLLPDLNQINANFEVGGEKVFIVYE